MSIREIRHVYFEVTRWLALAILVGLAPAWRRHAPGTEAISVSEVVDLACYLSKGSRGSATSRRGLCARRCRSACSLRRRRLSPVEDRDRSYGP
jgi:hypothetical protein